MVIAARRQLIFNYRRYLRHTVSGQFKEWGLIGDLSLKENQVRHQYLKNQSDLRPLRGTAVQRLEDDTLLQATQADFTRLFNAVVVAGEPMDLDSFPVFFQASVGLAEKLVVGEADESRHAPVLRSGFLAEVDAIVLAMWQECQRNLIAKEREQLFVAMASHYHCQVEELPVWLMAVLPKTAEALEQSIND